MASTSLSVVLAYLFTGLIYALCCVVRDGSLLDDVAKEFGSAHGIDPTKLKYMMAFLLAVIWPRDLIKKVRWDR